MDTDYEPTPLSLEEVQRLDDQNRGEYLALRRLFESEGWRLLSAWVSEQQRGQMNQQLIAKNWDSVLLCRGAFAAYETVRTLEQAMELVYRRIVEDAQGSSEADEV